MYEKKIAELIKQLGDERARYETAGEQLDVIKKLLSESQQKIQKALADTTQMYEKKIAELTKQLEDEHARFEGAEEQLDEAKNLLSCHQKPMQICFIRGGLEEMVEPLLLFEVFGLWDIGSIPLKLNEYIVSFVELRRDDGSSPYSL
ncbi:Kinesin-like protein KIN-UC [Vitis vinifera]|uniref:Kinesin-like protein KIN-UC n=1 Tax=Vitis vinifera TaxID=29760 RepID=A0A438DUS5_VITVI|nr:Kinesin-like protein KIN-UC [Vitis vinifera]